MSTHQEYYGKKFYQDKKTGYWISTCYPRMRAHIWVWMYYHGKPPKKCHIHHKDENKSNNDIENLEMVHGKRHLSHHMTKKMMDPACKKKAQENCERIRPLAKAWHASPEGHAWHRYHAIKTNFGNGPKFDYKCQQCSNPYKSKNKGDGKTKFCSNACKSAWRRKSGLDDIKKICAICRKTYTSNKYKKSVTCGRRCGQKIRVEKS